MQIKKENRSNILKAIGLLILVCGLFMLTYHLSMQVKLANDNDSKIEEFFGEDLPVEDNESSNDNEEQVNSSSTNYNYIAILEIPSISLKRGLVSPDSYYNNVNYNIQVIDTSTMPDVENGNLILASHNGASYISFFKNLDKLNINDKIYVYYQGYKYEYSLNNTYETKKDGNVEIYRNTNKTAITLITCKKNTKDIQEVYVGYLTNKELY